MKVKVKAAGGATRWGVINLQEIQEYDPGAKRSEDGHYVILSDGRKVKAGDFIEFEDNVDGKQL